MWYENYIDGKWIPVYVEDINKPHFINNADIEYRESREISKMCCDSYNKEDVAILCEGCNKYFLRSKMAIEWHKAEGMILPNICVKCRD